MIVFILYSLQQKKIIDIVYDFFFDFLKLTFDYKRSPPTDQKKINHLLSLWSIRGTYSAIWSLPLTNVK